MVATRWQGHGYASEAAVALVEWASEQDLAAVANIAAGHAASERVAARAGLEPSEHRVDEERVWR